MRKNKNANYAVDSRAKISSLIGKDVVFDGNMSAPDSIQIDGTLNGNCDCKAQLIIGVDGFIKGDVIAQNVLISGRIEGNIYAHGKIEILSTGVIAGNITSKSLVIDEGACFDGRCTMTNADNITPENYSSSENYSEGAYEDNGGESEDASDGKHGNKKKW